jgi:hypothetical protein
MGGRVETLKDRLAAGDTVTTTELTEAEAADRLADLESDAGRQRAGEAAEALRLAGIDATIAVFAVEVDEATDAVQAAIERAEAAEREVTRTVEALHAVAARHCDALVRLGFRVRFDEVFTRTAGRVLYDRDQASPGPGAKWPISLGYFTWRQRRRADLAGTAPTPPPPNRRRPGYILLDEDDGEG